MLKSTIKLKISKNKYIVSNKKSTKFSVSATVSSGKTNKSSLSYKIKNTASVKYWIDIVGVCCEIGFNPHS